MHNVELSADQESEQLKEKVLSPVSPDNKRWLDQVARKPTSMVSTIENTMHAKLKFGPDTAGSPFHKPTQFQ